MLLGIIVYGIYIGTQYSCPADLSKYFDITHVGYPYRHGCNEMRQNSIFNYVRFYYNFNGWH